MAGEEQLLERLSSERQQLLQQGTDIREVRIHPDDLDAIESVDPNSYVLDVIEATLFEVPFTEATDVPIGNPEFVTGESEQG